MDIVTLAAARKGSGGGASKEYVDEKVAALINDTTAALDKAYSSAKVEEKVAGEEITTTASGSDLTLSTSAGNLNALTVYGKSEVVDGAITSAGEGWATVDLGTLTWYYERSTITFYTIDIPNIINKPPTNDDVANIICSKYPKYSYNYIYNSLGDLGICVTTAGTIRIKDLQYDSDITAFKTAMSGVLLCYQLADPTQGNTIAVKTDNGTGVNGTMAVFETGTPLRGIPDTGVRDVMVWDGSSGEVTKNCAKIRLADLTWIYASGHFVTNSLNNVLQMPASLDDIALVLCDKYEAKSYNASTPSDKYIIEPVGITNYYLWVKDSDYTTVEDFVASLGDAELVYELATPTTQPLTSTENASIAGLRTFTPQTHAQNNAGAEMMIEAYAGTANGQAVQELKQDVQSEISELKITQSDTLTLTTAGWSNNAQTVTYAHDTAKRNVIDVDPASVEEWAICGVLATAETASGITFTCKTVPTNALNFKVTSMGV